MENIKVVVENFNGDLDRIKKELKRLQSIKCRLQKQKSRSDYDVKMTETLEKIQELQEARNYLEPKKVQVTTMTKSQIETLTYVETMRAIKSIQSKKCLTKDDDISEDYDEACKIEDMLLEHKNNNKPLEDTVISKKSIVDLINNLEQLEELDKDYVLEQLNNLL